MIRNSAPLVCRLRASPRLALAGLLLPLAASAQLQWSVFNETTTVPGPAATATSGVSVTVPAGERVTLVANNLVPFDLSAAGSEQVAAISFKVSGGLSNIAAGTRAVGFGLYNNNGTATNYSDDSGYFTWLNGRSTGSLIEQRRRIGNGVSPSLLNPTGTAFNNLSTGQASPTPGSMSDGNSYTIQFRLQGRSGSIAFGNTSANTAGGGIVVSGPGLQAITFSNPDAPAATFVFNEIGFMFLNTSSDPVTLTINSVTGLTPINPPAVATPPAAISLNPGQAGALSVVATGTAPLAYQWRKDGTNVAGATSATYSIASAATTDGGSYSVVITNAYGTVTSAAAAVTVTTTAIPATIANQPAPVTRNVGEDASFAVAAFGSSPVAYQWRKDGVAIAGATSTTLNLTSVTAASAGSYTVVVTAGGGATTVTSAPAVLAVNTAPAITTQPASVTTAAGQNVSFTVAATGSPAPSYQWSRNGAAIPGATSPTLTINNVSLANTGAYTVSLINDVGAVTSATAVLAIPSSMVAAAVSPANGAGAVNIDTLLNITFDRAPVVGTTGRIRIYKASDDTVVDTIDLGAPLKQRTVGTNATLYNFIPVTVTGNTATIYPRAGILAYGQTYYATVEQSAFLDGTGASFVGISDKNAWRFTTKASGPAATATALTVAANGSGDFTTVQGAIDSVPAGNTQRIVITVKKGTYNELVYIGATRPFITVRGEDRAQTIVGYPNNNNLNGTTATRAAFSIAANDSILENITIRNPTPQGGSQAEAVFTGALRVMLNRVNLLSRQDTLLTNTGTAFITDSYIEGNVDFMWGTAAAYYQRCELKALDVGTGNVGFYTQIRNGVTGFGAVYVDCKLTAADDVVGRVAYFLGRIDPGPGNFPYSQCMYLNCAMGPHIDPAGWRLDNATSSPTVQYWEYKNTDLDGADLDITRRHPSSRQLTDSEAALWRNPAFVLAGWNPQIGATIETAPAPQSAVVGANVRLSVVANGAPPPALQWLKNGTPITGETGDTLVLANVQLGDAGSYTVSATNSSGTTTSTPATVAVTRGAFAGTYSGTIGGSGSFALYVRDNGSAVLLTSGAGTAGTFAARAASVDTSGRIRANAGAYSVDATISATGAITGSIGPSAGSGITAPSVQLTGTRNAATGVSQSFVGYYQTGANNSAATASIIVSADGKAYVLAQSGATLTAGSGTVDSTGRVLASLAPAGSGKWEFVANVAAGGASATGTITTADAVIPTAGAGDSAASAQRFREFSARSVVSPTSATAVGFTIIGDAPNSVLVRAVGPTLADAFAVVGALPNPRLDIYRGNALIASNTNWTTSPNAAEAAFSAAQVGAFPLRSAAADSALRLTLQPGSYTAVISSGGGATSGTGLVEVYDLTAGAAGQRLVNVSVSGLAGTGLNTLIAGVVVTGTQPKRMLIRGVGPGLSGFGVTGPLARPVLSLYRGNTLVATNTGWGTSSDAAGIAAAAGEARAFALATGSADSAILVNLGSSLYTVALASADGTSGTALIEVYELP